MTLGDDLGAQVKEWAALGVLVVLGWLIRKLVIATYLRLKVRIDRAVPDHLPMGGGDWLRAQLPEGVRLFVASHGNAHADAFIPSANVIMLSRDVYKKHDASFWAVAAHELGHALVYRASRVVHAILLLGRVTVSVGTIFGSSLIFANVLYARPEVNAVAFSLLEASLVGYVLMLIDEALASGIAVRILGRDPRVNRRDMVGAITSLLAAFMTYLGGFVGQIVLILERDFVVGQIERHRHFVTAPPMGATRMTFVIILSVILVGWSLVNLRAVFRPRRYETSAEVWKYFFIEIGHVLGRGAVGGILVWLVWDQPYGSLMPLVCVAGLVASRAAIRIAAYIVELLVRVVAIVPALILYLPLYVLKQLVFGRKDDDEKEEEQKPPPDSERTKAALEALEVEGANRRSLYRTVLGALDPVLHLVFVIGLFVAIVGRR